MCFWRVATKAAVWNCPKRLFNNSWLCLRNGIPRCGALTEATSLCGMEGRIGGTKITGWDKNNWLESARKKKITSNSNNTNDKGDRGEVIDSQYPAAPSGPHQPHLRVSWCRVTSCPGHAPPGYCRDQPYLVWNEGTDKFRREENPPHQNSLIWNLAINFQSWSCEMNCLLFRFSLHVTD